MVLVQEVSKESQELMRKALEEVSCICVTNREFVFAVFFFLSFAGTGISFSLTFTAKKILNFLFLCAILESTLERNGEESLVHSHCK